MYSTNARKTIIEFLENNKHNSYSSLYLVDKFKDSINKATIYRNLKTLEEEGFIHKIYNESNKLYEYIYADDCDHHFHLKCVKCGKILHLHCGDADEFIGHIKKEHKFNVSEDITTIYGVCEDCLKC